MNIVGGHVLRHAEAHHSAGRPAYLSSMKAPQILRATQIVPCFTFAMKQAKGSRQKSRPLPAVLHLRIALSIRRASPVGWIFSSALEPRSPVNCRRHWGAGHRPPTDGAQGFRMSPVDDVRSAASYRSLSAPVSKTPAHRAPLRNLMEHRLLRVVPCEFPSVGRAWPLRPVRVESAVPESPVERRCRSCAAGDSGKDH